MKIERKNHQQRLIYGVVFFILFISQTQIIASPKSVLRIRIFSNPTSLDAILSSAGGDGYSWAQITESLVARGIDGSLKPKLATSWFSEDQKTWILELRKDVKFHDGTDFNAELVKWNIERAQNAKKSAIRDRALMIGQIEVLGKYKIKFILKQKNAFFLEYLTHKMAAIQSRKAIEAAGLDYARHPIGTGPFMFKSWKSGTEIVLEKNPNYWNKKRIHLDKLVYKIIPDEGNAYMNLASKELDLAINLKPIHITSIKANPNLTLYSRPSEEFLAIAFRQMDRPPFDNKWVRQAMAYVVDKEAINETLFSGMGTVASSGLSIDHWAHDTSIPSYKNSDLAKAKEMMAKAGYSNGLDGEYVYLTVPVFPYDKTAQIIQQQLGQIGIKINIVPVGMNALIKRLIRKEVPIVGASWSGGGKVDTMFQATVHSNGAYNNKAYINPEVDRLIEEARNSIDRTAQKKVFLKLQRLLAEDLPFIPIIHIPIIQASTSRLIGYEPQLDNVFNFEDVRLEKR